jgi:hypothetical protein
MRTLIGLSLVALALSACATRVVREPSRLISRDMGQLQGQVATFQDQWSELQTAERRRTSGYAARAGYAAADTRRLRTQWAVTAAATPEEMFQALKAHADEESRLVATPAPDELAPIKFPLDKLAAVAAATGKLGERRRSDEAKALLAFAKEVNADLTTLQTGADATAAAEPKKE